MAILLKKLAKAVQEYDRTQPERDRMYAAVWAYLDDTPKAKFSSKEFDRRWKEWEAAEEAARRKLGEAMWAEPTNINSYDKCMNLIDISTARKWITTTVEDHERWRRKHGKKFDEQFGDIWPKTSSSGVGGNSAPATRTKGRTRATSGSTAGSSGSDSKRTSKRGKSERVPADKAIGGDGPRRTARPRKAGRT